MRLKCILLLIVISLFLITCSTQQENNRIIIGIASDIETLNPLYSFTVEEGNITELLYLSLIENDWDSAKGDIQYSPMLAKSWEWKDNENAVVIELRDDVKWSDGLPCTIEDVIFSFDVYSDPTVKSRAYGYFDNFYTDEKGHIDSAKTFEVLDKNRLKIKFKKESEAELLDIDHPILPKHYWSKYKRNELSQINLKDSVITNGAYLLKRWYRGGAIILAKNQTSFLINHKTVDEIIFKVIPEYRNRLSQLMAGDIDLMEDIKTDDISNIRQNESIIIAPVSGRDFDYIGWNNISVSKYEAGKIVPNKLFGNAKVRRALTIALNRNAVVTQYLKGFGQLASTPVSPIFKSIYNSAVVPMQYRPLLAKKMLKEEGWFDSNHDGTIDKNGVEFQFTLHIPAGNPRRSFAASLFQNNLKEVGIDMTIATDELGVFIDNLFAKKYEAWMAAWVIPIPINLKISWYSDLETTPFNFASFQNYELDKLLDKLSGADKGEKKIIYYKIQEILADEQPYTFLYWIDNIVAYNKRVKNISADPLGTIKHCWQWQLN